MNANFGLPNEMSLIGILALATLLSQGLVLQYLDMGAGAGILQEARDE